MFEQWLFSYPELGLLDLEAGPGELETAEAAPLFPLARLLAPPDERLLLNCLALLAEGNATRAGLLAAEQSRKASLLPDMHLLAGAFHLSEARFAEAAEALRHCYFYGGNEERRSAPAGYSIRRVLPQLRLLLRISPVLLLPLYPDDYGAALMYAVALWHNGDDGRALEVLREVMAEHGVNDELKVVAAQIYLEQALDPRARKPAEAMERAAQAAAAPDQTQRDAVELARCLYLGLAYLQQGNQRGVVKELAPALTMAREANPHLQARGRLVLAEAYGQLAMPLHALRQSGMVAADEVPRELAQRMLQNEERWINALGAYGAFELERLARAEAYMLYAKAEDDEEPAGPGSYAPSKLDTSRNPLKDLRPTEMSWLRRQEEERQIAAMHAAAARGETVAVEREEHLSPEAREMRARIRAAQNWWPSRRESLASAAPRERLARQGAAAVGHLRFDLNGQREAPPWRLTGEKRMQLIAAGAGLALLIWLILILTRSCVYFGQ